MALCARWSSLVARRAHNPKVEGSNPSLANFQQRREHPAFKILYQTPIQIYPPSLKGGLKRGKKVNIWGIWAEKLYMIRFFLALFIFVFSSSFAALAEPAKVEISVNSSGDNEEDMTSKLQKVAPTMFGNQQYALQCEKAPSSGSDEEEALGCTGSTPTVELRNYGNSLPNSPPPYCQVNDVNFLTKIKSIANPTMSAGHKSCVCCAAPEQCFSDPKETEGVPGFSGQARMALNAVGKLSLVGTAMGLTSGHRKVCEYLKWLQGGLAALNTFAGGRCMFKANNCTQQHQACIDKLKIIEDVLDECHGGVNFGPEIKPGTPLPHLTPNGEVRSQVVRVREKLETLQEKNCGGTTASGNRLIAAGVTYGGAAYASHLCSENDKNKKEINPLECEDKDQFEYEKCCRGLLVLPSNRQQCRDFCNQEENLLEYEECGLFAKCLRDPTLPVCKEFCKKFESEEYSHQKPYFCPRTKSDPEIDEDPEMDDNDGEGLGSETQDPLGDGDDGDGAGFSGGPGDPVFGPVAPALPEEDKIPSGKTPPRRYASAGGGGGAPGGGLGGGGGGGGGTGEESEGEEAGEGDPTNILAGLSDAGKGGGLTSAAPGFGSDGSGGRFSGRSSDKDLDKLLNALRANARKAKDMSADPHANIFALHSKMYRSHVCKKHSLRCLSPVRVQMTSSKAQPKARAKVKRRSPASKRKK